MKFTSLVSSLVAGMAALAPVAHAGSCCHAPAEATPGSAVESPALPGASLFHQTATWVDQDNRSHKLADFAGTPVLISMVFTHCGFACPRTVEDLHALREAMPPAVRDNVRIVLASFDVERDTPERLRAWADLHGFDARWTLLHGDEAAVRELAVLLDIAYQKQPDGSFAHANRIVLLDPAGVPVAALDGLGAAPAPLLEAAARLGAPAVASTK